MAARRAELKRTDATAKNVRDQTRGGRAARRPALGSAGQPSRARGAPAACIHKAGSLHTVARSEFIDDALCRLSTLLCSAHTSRK